MKTYITLAAALATLGLSVPAVAQSNWNGNNRSDYQDRYDNSDHGVQQRIDQLRQRVQYGVERRTLTRQEAQFLRDQLRQLIDREQQYSRNGLNRDERNDLQRRVQYLQQQIVAAERNRDRRGDDRRWDDDGRRDDGRWDDRRYDDRRYDDDRRYRN